MNPNPVIYDENGKPEYDETNYPVLTSIADLRPGDKFQIPSVQDTMRDMTVISSNHKSTLINGFKRNTVRDKWRPFRMRVSNGIVVHCVDTFEKEGSSLN